MSFRFSELAAITHGTILSLHEDQVITHLITDSRSNSITFGSLFIAIKGKRHDGHLFIQDLYKKGIRQFIVEKDAFHNAQLAILTHANIIAVDNSINALQKLASIHRSHFQLPVIGITGSNGKTIVKEWLAQLLAKDYCIIKNPKSYNSQIGVPLSVWQINASHDLGIFEAGISEPGEMEKLEKIICPEWGIFTTIGTAHDEGFLSTEQKIEEKLKLFKHSKLIIYRKDYTLIDTLVPKSKKLTWSLKDHTSDLYVAELIKTTESCTILIHYAKSSYSLTIPFSDDASIENSLHCITLLFYLSIPVEEIQQRVSLLKSVSMRLELKQGINDCYLIDDTYNNDLAGIEMALDFLAQQPIQKTKTVILSDVLESSMTDEELYKQIGLLLTSRHVERLIGIGDHITMIDAYFNGKKEFYKTTSELIKNTNRTLFQHEIILIKGARKFEFEKIAELLQQKIHGTILEVNLDALTHNLNFYRNKLTPNTKLMVMVKALAYGSGSYEVAHLLQFHRVDYLAVAYADEGIYLREHGISLPIMVMNPSEDAFEKIVNYHLEPEIYSIRLLESLQSYLTLTKKNCSIHLEIETGMHRLGIEEKDIDKLCIILKNNPSIRIKSIFSHLAASEDSNQDSFSKKQINQFQKLAKHIESTIEYSCIKHILNSAGIIRFPEAHMDMVRLGIGLYGIGVAGEESLIPVSRLKTTISQIKEIPIGDSVGYGRKKIATQPLRIATIAIGYADGFSRAFSNGVGSVWVNGKKASVVGNVCMDMTMIDITTIDAKEGDEVVIFGKELSITKVADWIHTIPYELLTQLNDRVKRVYYKE